MLTITIAALRRHKACVLDARVAELRAILPDVGEEDPVPVRAWWALPSTSIEDRFWSLRAISDPLAAQRIGVAAACRAARRVLPLTRERDRAVCLAAIEAAERWVESPGEEEADAAYAAAYAADAADAADAANAAAYAAADAAADAAYAANAAAAYAADAANAANAAAYAARAAAERARQRADLDELLEGL